jgi:virulence factor Mce-like protein
MTPRRANRTVLGSVVLAVALVAFALVFTNAPSRWLAPRGETVRAVFTDAQQIRKGDPVRVDGVEAGRVSDIDRAADGRSATVAMVIYEHAQPLYADARAAIRSRTLLGALFVVDLDRGSAAAGELRSGTIPRARTSNQTLIEDVVNGFRQDARAGLRSTLSQLPPALADHTAPARALGAVAGAAPGLARGVRAVRGRQEGDLARLVAGASRTVDALNHPAADAGRLVSAGGTTVAAIARRADALDTSIARLAHVTPDVRRTLLATGRTLRAADPLVAELRDTAPDVRPSAQRLRGTVERADALLTRARPLVRALRPAAHALAETARQGAPLLDALRPSLDRLDQRILPDLAVESPETKHATYEMIGPTVAGLTGAFSYFDGENFFVRFPASGSEQVLDSAPCRTYLTNTARRDEIADCKALAETLGGLLSQPGKRR